MKWENATLVSKLQTGKDELSNPIYEEQEIMVVKARFQPWTKSDIEIEEREVTQKQRKIILRMKYNDFPVCQKIKIDDLYEITEVKDLTRFVALFVKVYKK